MLWHPIWYRSDSSWHRAHDNHLDICGAAVVSRRQQGEWIGVECKCKLYIIIIIQFWDFTWYSVVYISLQTNTLLCYTLVSVLVLGTGIARGQYYWILDIGCLAWYRSNHNIFIDTISPSLPLMSPLSTSINGSSIYFTALVKCAEEDAQLDITVWDRITIYKTASLNDVKLIIIIIIIIAGDGDLQRSWTVWNIT